MPERAGPEVLDAGDPVAITAAALAMDAGGIVGLPTETVYGIGVVPRPEPLRALIAAKGRADDKGIVLLIDGLDQVDGLVELSEPARRLAARFWPGALTLILPLARAGSVPDSLTGGRDRLGLRLPDHAVPRALARRLGPVAVTSANRTGEPAAMTAGQVVEAVGSSLALVLDAGPVREGVASTVVDVSSDGSLQVIRSGALDPALLRDVARSG